MTDRGQHFRREGPAGGPRTRNIPSFVRGGVRPRIDFAKIQRCTGLVASSSVVPRQWCVEGSRCAGVVVDSAAHVARA